MFTGIIEEIGTVKDTKSSGTGAILTVSCADILQDAKIGDSIAINGACQTVVSLGTSSFSVDVSDETLEITNLNHLKPGNKVNLERAMPANGRFDGHVVSGHVDGTGKFLRRETKGAFTRYYFEAPANIEKYMIYKGSITVNGISLTIASLENNIFSVAVIPHTDTNTTLHLLNEEDTVNLEPDLFAKYIEKFLTKNDNTNTKISMDYLEEHGFLD